MVSYWLTWLNFSVAWAGSWKIGAQFPNVVQLPMMVGYMSIGFVCSEYVTGMLYPETLHGDFSVASVVSHLSLSFIAMSAGAELDFFALDDERVKQILAQIVYMGFLMVVTGTPLIYLMEGLMPESLMDQGIWCRWSAALMVAVVQLAGSVIEVLGIYYETQGQAASEGRPPGPVTQLMIGTTMLLDMIVLVFFAITQNIVVAACPLEEDEHAPSLVTGAGASGVLSVGMVFGSVFLWVTLGVALGCLLWAILLLPKVDERQWTMETVKSTLIVVTAGASYFAMLKLNQAIPRISPDLQLLRVDPLLVCMIAASFVIHKTDQRNQLREILSGLAPVVMPPFFTVAGASLELGAIMQNAFAVPLLFGLRFVALAVGSYGAAVHAGQDEKIRKHVWMTLQSQSGVTLGLVAQMRMGLVGKRPWAPDTAALITGCVVLNQLVGPTLCRKGIQMAGEATDEELLDKVSPLNELLTLGPAQTSLVDSGAAPDGGSDHAGSDRSRLRTGSNHGVFTSGNRPRVLSNTSAMSWGSSSLPRSALGPLVENETARTQRALSAVVADPERMVTGTAMTSEPFVSAVA
jgi:Kef-type K+ transport system membrane component KefB